MPSFTWDESYNVNVPEIDAQHRGLVDLINNLHQVLMEEDDAGRLAGVKAQTVDALVEYGVKHFESEEVFMRSINYPYIEDHRKEHQAFITKVNEYREELKTAHAVHASRVMKIMTDWLHDHLLTKDRKYGQFADGRTA